MCVTICVCCVYVRDRKCFLPRGLSLKLSVKMSLLSIVYSGLFGEMSDSSVSRSTVRLWQFTVSDPAPAQCFTERERERPGGGEDDRRGGARGEHKKMEEQHLWPSERNPGAIQKKRTNWQKGIVSAFLLSLLHLLFSVSLQIYSRCLQNRPPPRKHPSPPPLCLPAPGNCRLAEIFLFK